MMRSMIRTWAREILVLLVLIVVGAALYATYHPNPYDGFVYDTLITSMVGCIYLLLPAWLAVRLVRSAINR